MNSAMNTNTNFSDSSIGPLGSISIIMSIKIEAGEILMVTLVKCSSETVLDLF